MKLDHLGLAVKNIDEASKFYRNSLGWKEKSKIFQDPIQKVNILFMVDENDFVYELLEPTCQDSPVSRFLEKRISLYHFCYVVENIDQKLKELTSKGFYLISGPTEAIAFEGKNIAFLINRDNLIIELVEQ